MTSMWRLTWTETVAVHDATVAGAIDIVDCHTIFFVLVFVFAVVVFVATTVAVAVIVVGSEAEKHELSLW